MIRAPFRPAKGEGKAQVRAVVANLSERRAPVICDGLRIEVPDGFVVLTPAGREAARLPMGAEAVEGTHDLRVLLTATGIARRRPGRPTVRQRELRGRRGYPHVIEKFRVHPALTDRRESPDPTRAAHEAHFVPVLPRPFGVSDLGPFGEDAAGLFHRLHRYALTG